MRAAILLLAWAVAAPGAALAQAEGTFPGTLSCDPLRSGSAPVRTSVTVAIADSRASYAFPAPSPTGGASGATETGGGSLEPSRRLALTGTAKGRGFSYAARYAGNVGGRGGTLTGNQIWIIDGKRQTRACQLALGDGRG